MDFAAGPEAEDTVDSGEAARLGDRQGSIVRQLSLGDGGARQDGGEGRGVIGDGGDPRRVFAIDLPVTGREFPVLALLRASTCADLRCL